MSPANWAQLAAACALTVALGWPLGAWLARVFDLDRPLPGEATLRRWAALDPREQDWRAYATSLLVVQALGLGAVFLLQQVQGVLPLNPQGMGAVSWHSSVNTAVSFVTNTNWQAYSGERTMSYLTQALGLGVQNFLSAATGLAVAAALARGLSRPSGATVGSFSVDLTRGVVYVLLPLSFVLALALVSQGVVQTFGASVRTGGLDGGAQLLAVGPVASQEAIKQLGTNGGGFFNANAAHPFENPTPLSNLLETVAILVLPVACTRMFGRMVGDERQGRAMFAAMALLVVPLLLAAPWLEAGNLEGKEVRFGVAGSALWAVFTTAASNGSVNAMHDSFTALGGLVPLWLILLGEVAFGGVGSGLYGMVLFVLVAVFLAGLMVGRTPEYLGKKVEAREMKLAALGVLAPCAAVLVGAAVSVSTAAGRAGVLNAGPHGFTEVLYAWASAANNNGSAFAGLSADTPHYNLGLAAAMLVGRFAVLLPVLGIAGSMVGKKRAPAGPGTLPTHGPLFVALLAATVVLVGALSFLPALALGPIAEHFGGVQ